MLIFRRSVTHNDKGKKWCSGYDVFHPLDAFAARKASWDGKCRHKISYIRRIYGLELEEYEQIMATGCAICGATLQYLEHCHATGRIRGALCGPCNMALGLFQDDLGRLRAAARYIEGDD